MVSRLFISDTSAHEISPEVWNSLILIVLGLHRKSEKTQKKKITKQLVPRTNGYIKRNKKSRALLT